MSKKKVKKENLINLSDDIELKNKKKRLKKQLILLIKVNLIFSY